VNGGIFIGLGANLPGIAGSPQATLEEAVAAIAAAGVSVLRRSPWYESAPVPRADDQPWFVNGIIEVATGLDPAALLAILQGVEAAAGRVRSAANAPRTLDLDIIAYAGLVWAGSPPLLPHPRMQERAFVLLPLRDIAPDWRHPLLGKSAGELLAALPPGQEIRLA
jgi:2-amino-4-hydroxy-6-hydroxymethyldihydropteridine diphosphokinase